MVVKIFAGGVCDADENAFGTGAVDLVEDGAPDENLSWINRRRRFALDAHDGADGGRDGTLISAEGDDGRCAETGEVGAYTATVAGKNNTTGVSLVEVYELPCVDLARPKRHRISNSVTLGVR